MPTIFFLALLALLDFMVFCPAYGQQAGKVYRVGYLDRGDARTSAVRMEPFWQELRRLGWIDGKNITIDSRFAENGPEDLTAAQAAELVQLKTDVIVCASTGAALRAKKATASVPIVFVNSSDPVGTGLVSSLSRPGGNVTGTTGMGADLNTKRLEVLKDAVPKLTRVGTPRTLTSASAV
jgi:putative ABC transport system substrate-binding protein